MTGSRLLAVGQAALLTTLACLDPEPGLATSEPDPCGAARVFPSENVALYPPGPTLAVGSQLGVFV